MIFSCGRSSPTRESDILITAPKRELACAKAGAAPLLTESPARCQVKETQIRYKLLHKPQAIQSHSNYNSSDSNVNGRFPSTHLQ